MKNTRVKTESANKAIHPSSNGILDKITSNSLFQWDYKEPFKAFVLREIRKNFWSKKK